MVCWYLLISPVIAAVALCYLEESWSKLVGFEPATAVLLGFSVWFSGYVILITPVEGFTLSSTDFITIEVLLFSQWRYFEGTQIVFLDRYARRFDVPAHSSLSVLHERLSTSPIYYIRRFEQSMLLSKVSVAFTIRSIFIWKKGFRALESPHRSWGSASHSLMPKHLDLRNSVDDISLQACIPVRVTVFWSIKFVRCFTSNRIVPPPPPTTLMKTYGKYSTRKSNLVITASPFSLLPSPFPMSLHKVIERQTLYSITAPLNATQSHHIPFVPSDFRGETHFLSP